MGIDKTANDQFTYTDTGPEFIPPDVVTNSSPIFVSATQLIESVNVGMVVDSPQISDMTFTLVSPTGQRILLMENRGANSTNGAGAQLSLYQYPQFHRRRWRLRLNTNYLTTPGYAIAVPITYNFYAVPDEMTVYEGEDPTTFFLGSSTFLYDTGFTNFAGAFNVTVQPGFTDLTIIMNQFGKSVRGWRG